ncbi:MAG: DNA double-strand break repair nuclease NurA [Tepidiformaceae bacterium]
MTLRMERALAQLPAVVERYAEGLRALDAGLAAAEQALSGWAADPAGADSLISAAMANSPEPYALSFEGSPADVHAPPPFGAVTVVAADGSSIEPDRFAAVQCYVLNTGFVALPYGLAGTPILDSLPHIGPTQPPPGGDDHGEDELGPAGWGVNLRRDVAELDQAARLAQERAPDGPVVLLLDGTLFPWDLDSPRVAKATRDDLKERTQDALDLVYALGEGVSIGAYISGSRSGDVTTSLRALSNVGGIDWPSADGHLFARLLGDGERTALFRARSERVSRVEKLFSPRHEVCFFYIRIGDDVARVEVPHWATAASRVERLHATIIDQCARCGGYPRALQEAHEQAVISMGDRLQFSRLLESEAARHALRSGVNSKQMSKRRRAV